MIKNVKPASRKLAKTRKFIKIKSRIGNNFPIKQEEKYINKAGRTSHTGNEEKSIIEEGDLALLRKIDFLSFIAYLMGYIFFNLIYWSYMFR